MPARILLMLLLFPVAAMAAETSPTVEDNIIAMDADRDGMVSMQEVRSYLEKKNQNGAYRNILDDLDADARGRSCSSPFTKSVF